MTTLTAGLSTTGTRILLTDMNWQIENGLSYFAKQARPGLAYARMPDVILYAPALVADNRAIGREVVADVARARDGDRRGVRPAAAASSATRASPCRRLSETSSSGLPPGTRYVLCVLQTDRAISTLDADDLDERHSDR